MNIHLEEQERIEKLLIAIKEYLTRPDRRVAHTDRRQRLQLHAVDPRKGIDRRRDED